MAQAGEAGQAPGAGRVKSYSFFFLFKRFLNGF